MANEETIGIWNYLDIGFREKGILLKAEFRLPSPKKWSDPIQILVDTSYDGEILLSYDLFVLAGYSKFRFPSDQQNTAQSITGDIFELIKTNSIMRINEKEFDVLIETHSSIDENLMGRAFLNRFIAELDGKGEQWRLFEY